MGDPHGFSRMARGRGGGVGVLTLMFGHAADMWQETSSPERHQQSVTYCTRLAFCG